MLSRYIELLSGLLLMLGCDGNSGSGDQGAVKDTEMNFPHATHEHDVQCDSFGIR